MGKRGALWNYLKESGVLDLGDDESIAKARLEFTRKRDREYKAKSRLRMREHVVRLEVSEDARIASEAHKYGMPITEFLKCSCLANMDRVYVVPDAKAVRRIEAAVVRTLSAIERISARETGNWLVRRNDFAELMELVADLRREIKKDLCMPDLLMQAVINNPAQWGELLKAMRYDCKDIGNKKQ